MDFIKRYVLHRLKRLERVEADFRIAIDGQSYRVTDVSYYLHRLRWVRVGQRYGKRESPCAFPSGMFPRFAVSARGRNRIVYRFGGDWNI